MKQLCCLCVVPAAQGYAVFACSLPAGLSFPFTPLNASGEAWTPDSLLLYLLKMDGSRLG